MGRTVRELEASLGHDEWLEWIAFHGLYDLPDGFCVVGKLGPPLAGIGGVHARSVDFSAYYQPPPGQRGRDNLGGAFAFIQAHVKPTE